MEMAAWGVSVCEEQVQGPLGFDAKEVWHGGIGRRFGACHSGLPDSGASMGSAGLSFLGAAGM